MSGNLTQLDKYLEKITHPECFGPGKWDDLHILGLDANTYAKKMAYIHNVELIINSMRCIACRQDALIYLQKNPLTDYWGLVVKGEDVGMFYWSVDFHNWVNRKLGKIEVPRDVAYQFYKHPEEFVCKDGCGENSSLENSTKREIKKVSGFVPL